MSSFPQSFSNFPCWSSPLQIFFLCVPVHSVPFRCRRSWSSATFALCWVRLLTVLVVICIRVVLVWRLKDADSIPQVELKLLSDLKYSQFLSLLSSYLAVPTCFLLVLCNLSLALVMTTLWSLPTCPHLCALVSSREITTWQFLLYLLRLTHKHTQSALRTS